MHNDVVCQMLFSHEEELLAVMTSGNASFCFFFCNRNLPKCVFFYFKFHDYISVTNLGFFVCFIYISLFSFLG